MPGTPWFALWQRFGERAREALPGFAVRLLIRGELGAEEHAIAKLRRGRIEMAGLSLQGAATLVPELSLILSPYQFSSPAEADRLLDGPLWPLFAERFRAKGLELLQWAEVGLTTFTPAARFAAPRRCGGFACAPRTPSGRVCSARRWR